MSLLPANTENIEIDKINIGTTQARQRGTKVFKDDDLVISIRKHGMISPIVVKRLEGGRYDLLVGQRRFRAHELLEKPTIQAYVVTEDIDEYEAKKLSLVENAARKDMKHADYVDTVQRFMEKYNSTKTVAEELGLSVNTVRKYINIGRLPPEIQAAVHRKEYSVENAIKALKALGDDESTVDVEMLHNTAIEMKRLSPQAQNKFIEIKKKEPDTPSREVAEKAKKRVEIHIMKIELTPNQQTRIDAFKKRQELETDKEAVSDLVDLGLDAADV